jgi:4-amino-4-deoxy-L-arabinose transferase-like glycosyltransferase
MKHRWFTERSFTTGQWLLALIFLGFFLRLYVVLNAVTISVDGFGYINITKGFLEGNLNEGLSVFRRPLYPFLLGFVSLIVDDFELSGRIVSLVFGTLVIPVSFYLGRTIYNERVGLFAAFFVSIHPYMVRYSGEVLTEGLYYFLIAAVTLLGLKAVSKRSAGLMSLAGLIAFFTFLTRPGAIVIWGVITLWAVSYDFHKIREDWRRSSSLLVIGLSIFTLMALVNMFFIYKATGQWGLAGTSTMTSSIGMDRGLLLKTANFLKYFPEAFSVPFLLLFLYGTFRQERQGLVQAEYYLLSVFLACLLFYVVIDPRRRYFVHLMPAALVFSAVGFYHVEKLLKTRAREKAALFTAVLILVIMAFQLPKGMVSLHAHRLPERLAGEWLKEHEGGPYTIMARKPIVAFYAEGDHLILPRGRLEEIIEYGGERGAEYMAGYALRLGEGIPDFDTDKERFLAEVKSFKGKNGKEFIIYRFGI